MRFFLTQAQLTLQQQAEKLSVFPQLVVIFARHQSDCTADCRLLSHLPSLLSNKPCVFTHVTCLLPDVASLFTNKSK